MRLDQNSFMEDNRGERFSPWSTYSDMFCSLLMVFMLLFFYAMMQYVSSAAVDAAELETLREEQTALTEQSELQQAEAEALLAEAQSRAETAEQALLEAEIELAGLRAQLDSADVSAENDVQTKQKLGERIIELERETADLEQSLAEGLRREAELQAQNESLAAENAELLAGNESLLAENQKLADDAALLDGENLTLTGSLADAEARIAELEASAARQQTVIAAQEAVMTQQNRALEEVAGIRVEIIQALGQALEENGLEASVDSGTGAIVLRSELLFGVNESELKPEGKAFLDEFLPVYFRVLTGEDFADAVAQITVEGHTDTAGSYQANLELSMKRAQSVVSYCVSLLDGDDRQRLTGLIAASGCSYSNPILNEDGSVDMDRSRRVEIKFTMKDQSMIDEIMRIVED